MGDYYEVVSGSHSRREGGKRVRYQVGDAFEATPQEIVAFGDKLRKVTKRVWGGVDLPKDDAPEPEPAFDVTGNTIDVVLEAVAAGVIAVDEALELERAGKGRKRLLSELEALHGDTGQ